MKRQTLTTLIYLALLMPFFLSLQAQTPPPGPSNLSCTDDLLLATPCYVNGAPLGDATSSSATTDAFVIFNYNDNGEPTGPAGKTIPASAIGATWGVAYCQQTQTIYTSAFMKRHVGFGPLGTGGIYAITGILGTPSATSYFDVSTIPGIDVGADTRTSVAVNEAVDAPNELPTEADRPSWDADAFDAVGKRSLGDMDISPDGNTLWVMNVFEKELIALDISGGTPTLIDTINVPDPGCSDGDYRPWAVKVHDNRIWVGTVCSAETSQNTLDLAAHIQVWNGTTWAAVYDFPLNYLRGSAGNGNSPNSANWQAWTDIYQSVGVSNSFAIYPQPILSDIEFDNDGSMILAFMDRMGHQTGISNFLPDPTATNTADQPSGQAAGDILRVCNVGGTYQLENNASCDGGTTTTGGVNNNRGPGGGEYYWGDTWDYNPFNFSATAFHQETSFGGLAFMPDSAQVLMTAMNPTNSANSGGVVRFNSDATRPSYNTGYRLYSSAGAGSGTFAKANGLGDLEVLCTSVPPVDCQLTITDVNVGSCSCDTGTGYADFSTLDASANLTGTFADFAWSGQPTMDIHYNRTGGTLNGGTWADGLTTDYSNLGFNGSSNDVPRIYTEINSGGSSTITFDFDYASDNFTFLAYDIDWEDNIQITALDADGNTISNFSNWTAVVGDMTTWNPNGGATAPSPNWDPTLGTISSSTNANENRSFIALTPDVAVSELTFTFTSGSDPGPHVYYAFYGLTGGTCTTTLDVEATWTDAPTGENINISLPNTGTTNTIDVIGGATSPTTVQFTVAADGTTANPITAQFSGGTCEDIDETFDAPANCNINCPPINCLPIQIEKKTNP